MAPLYAAFALLGLGIALLVARALVLRADRALEAEPPAAGESMSRPPKKEREMSTALATPSEVARAALKSTSRPLVSRSGRAAPAAPETPMPAGEEAPLSEEQRERVDRLMAAVKSEFNSLLEDEKKKQAAAGA